MTTTEPESAPFTEMAESEFVFRPMQPADVNFICDSIVKSLHDKYPWKFMDRQTWSAFIRPRLSNLMARSSVLVCCDPDDARIIWGFCLYEQPNTLHYVYTKYLFRGYGIGKAMVTAALPDAGDIVITTLPPRPIGQDETIDDFLSKYHLSYNPFQGLLA